MLDDVERKVVRPAKTPYGQSHEKSRLECGELGKQQDRRRQTQRQKQTALQPDNRVVPDVFYNGDWGMVPGSLKARDRYFAWLTAHSHPPAAAKYSVPLATTGEAQIRDPRLILSRTSSVLPAFNIQRYFAVGM